jgi:Na+-translocating ferredoxin:NAD+ oxidoreductase RnfG subunit
MTKSITWMVLSLFIVCLISAGLLSKVYTMTRARINLMQNKKTQQNLVKVSTDTISNQNNAIDTIMLSCLCRVLPAAKSYNEIIKDTLWIVNDEKNQIIGIVFKVAPQGYSGLIPIWVGLGSDTIIQKIFIETDELKETPGLGTQIGESSFQKQFYNRTLKELSSVRKQKVFRQSRVQQFHHGQLSKVFVLVLNDTKSIFKMI